MTATAFTVTHGETFEIGHTPDAARRTVTRVSVEFEGTIEHFYAHGNQFLVECGMCDGGTKIHHRNVFGGVCFQCSGRGFSKVIDSITDIERIVRRRVRDRQRAERKAAEKVAASDAWRSANPEAAALAAEVLDDGPQGQSDADVMAGYAWEERWGGFVTDLANRSQFAALTEKQTAAFVKAVTEAKAAAAAKAERVAASRYYGAKGEKVAIVGTVTVATSIATSDYYGNPSSAMLVIVEGEGEYAGVTAKAFGTGKTLWDAEKGQSVTISGTVKDHAERDGIPQTVLTRAKVAVR